MVGVIFLSYSVRHFSHFMLQLCKTSIAGSMTCYLFICTWKNASTSNSSYLSISLGFLKVGWILLVSASFHSLFKNNGKTFLCWWNSNSSFYFKIMNNRCNCKVTNWNWYINLWIINSVWYFHKYISLWCRSNLITTEQHVNNYLHLKVLCVLSNYNTSIATKWLMSR